MQLISVVLTSYNWSEALELSINSLWCQHDKGFEIINAEAGRLAGEKEKLLSDSTYNSYNYNHFSYIERSKYAEQVENWLQFFSKDQMLILSSEEFFSDTGTQLDKVYRRGS